MPGSAKQDHFIPSAEAAAHATEPRVRDPLRGEDRFEVDSWEPSLLERMRKVMSGKAIADD